MRRDVNLYTDPELYDAENSDVDELEILIPLAEQTGGLIIDLACGTGRTRLPPAQAGFDLVGVDMSEPMLALAREKARDRGLSVAFLQQDCRRLDLPTTAARTVTMTGNAFQEFLTNEDQDGLLRSVDRHLERLLATHLFDLERVHGGWDASPPAADSRELVVVARKRG